MMQEPRPKPLLSGIVYGECVFWLALAGMIMGMIGVGIWLSGDTQFFDADILMHELLAGEDVRTIWETAAGSDVLHRHWYISRLSYGDGMAMLGVGICCCAAVIGTWAAVVTMLLAKERPFVFVLFGLVIAVILSVSAAGVIAVD